MFSAEFTRAQIAEKLGLKGKELTAELRSLKRQGKIIQRRKFVEPTVSNKKVTVFQYVAVNMELGLSS